MIDTQTALKQLSLASANYGNTTTFRDVLTDWFKFLGGRPGEVVIVDGGSDPAGQAVYWQLFNDGKIDKLQVIRPEHSDNHKDLCFLQEHTAGAIASQPYLLFYKSDTLPFRQGHDNWLPEALEYLDRPDTFAIGGSFNNPSKHHDGPWPGWYFSHKCSLNFCLMKRESFIAAMQEFAGPYIASGFRGESPAAQNRQARYLVEVAFERYIENHKKYTLCREEDSTWTIFHTNAQGPRLAEVRQDYLARRDIDKYINARSYNPVWRGCYYGKPPARWVRFKWFLSESPLGPFIRLFKRAIGIKPATKSAT